MSAPPSDKRRSQLAAAHILQGKVESARQRSVFDTWRAFVKHRQFEVHLKRCATAMKHGTRRRMYSTYFLRWLAATQRSTSVEARESYRIPQEVPLTTKKSVLAFTRRYFLKWRRHNRERRQRTVANVDAIASMNDERRRYRALLSWQSHALRKRMMAPLTTAEVQESTLHLLKSAERAVDVLGGHFGGVEVLRPSPNQTPEETASLLNRTADVLNGLCEDLVVVRVLANEWSNNGGSGQVSALLERLWHDNGRLKSDAEEKNATIDEQQCVMEELLACLNRKHKTDEDATAAQKRRQEAELAAKYASENGNDVPARLLKAAESATSTIQAAEHGLAQQTEDAEALQNAVARALAFIGGEETRAALSTDAGEDRGRSAILSDALDQLTAEVTQAAAEVDSSQTRRLPDLLRALQKRCEDAKRHDAALSEQLAAAESALANARGELGRARETSQQHLTEVEGELAALKVRAAELGSQLEQSNSAVEQLEAQLREQTEAAERADTALKASREEAARQASAMHDLERSSKNAAKRLDQLADQFEAKSLKYRDNEAQRVVEIKELQAVAERALVALQGKEPSDALLAKALTSSGDPSTGGARSRALVDALDVACHSLEGLLPGESVAEFMLRSRGEKSAAEAQLQARRDKFDKLDHIVTVATDLLLRPRLSEVSIEGAGAVVAADALATEGFPGAKALMTAVHAIVDEACSCFETLPKRADHGVSDDPRNSTAGESVKDVLKLCGDALYEVTEELTTSVQATTSSEALSVFLRDVVRDAIGRVAALANNLCATLGGETSRSAWQSLQLTDNPMPLSMHCDPSEYVEYVLLNVDLSDEGKRAVQDHLRSEAALEPRVTKSAAHSAGTDGASGLGSTLDPSTSQERREEAAGSDAPPPTHPSGASASPPCTWDVVAEFHDLLAMLTDLSVQYDEKFVLQGKQIKDLDDALKRMNADLGLPDDAAPEAVAQAVHDAARACQVWRSFADDCIEAMGRHRQGEDGAATNTTAAARSAMDPAVAESVGTKLLADCGAATDVVRDMQQCLGLVSASPTADGAPLANDLKAISSQINQLQSLRDESDALIDGLNHAFDDDSFSTSTTSTLSSRGRSLRSKKKPLPVATIKSGDVFTLKRGVKPTAKALDAMTPKEQIRALRACARDKLEEVQELRRACRTALFILEGTYTPLAKAPAYGGALVPRLLQQLEDLKKALPLTDAHLSGHANASSTSDAEPVSATVGARLTALAAMVNSLQLTQAGLEESLAAKARQGALVLQDSQRENTQLKAQRDTARQQLQEARAACDATKQKLDAVEADLEDRNSELSQLKAQAEAASKALEDAKRANTVMGAQLDAERGDNAALTNRAAVLQHAGNVLSAALANALSALTPSRVSGGPSRIRGGSTRVGDSRVPFSSAATAPLVWPDTPDTSAPPAALQEVEKELQRLLRVEDGAGVAALVQQTLAQHRQWLGRLGGDYQRQLQVLRWDLEALKAYAMQGFSELLQPLCAAVSAEIEDSVQLLSVENEMLRPRALEREKLADQNEALAAALAHKETELRAAQTALENADDNNARLRRALAESKMVHILNDGDGSEDDVSVAAPGNSGTNTDTTIDRTRYIGSGAYAALLEDLEAKMIRGATAMTVEAIDAISGHDMAKTFGAVAEDTCELYQCVRDTTQALLDAFSMYPPTNAFNQRCLEEVVDAEMQALNQHADHAKLLWDRLPPFFSAPYRRV